MNSIIQKTFGGVTRAFYWRQFIFGLIFFMAIVFANKLPFWVILFSLVCLFLYPYSRFVYHSITDFLLGNNTIFVPFIILFPVKLLTMTLCYVWAPFIAPIGLVYLYFHHSRQNK